jgi:flagellar motility protein MotE (MotC chaperone)
MNKILQAPWVVPLLGSLVYLATTFVLISPQRLGAARREQQVETAHLPSLDPSWNFRNPEFDQLVNELRREKEALKVREQELKALEARLQSERQEISLITQSVVRLQKEFDQNVVRLKDEEVPSFRKLAKLHSTMSPEGAANLLREMPDEDVVKILAFMKVDEASAILDTLGRLGKTEAKRVAVLTEKMRRTLPPTAGATKPAP